MSVRDADQEELLPSALASMLAADFERPREDLAAGFGHEPEQHAAQEVHLDSEE